MARMVAPLARKEQLDTLAGQFNEMRQELIATSTTVDTRPKPKWTPWRVEPQSWNHEFKMESESGHD